MDLLDEYSSESDIQSKSESALQVDSANPQHGKEVPDISSEKDFKREGFATLLKELSKEL